MLCVVGPRASACSGGLPWTQADAELGWSQSLWCILHRSEVFSGHPAGRPPTSTGRS